MIVDVSGDDGLPRMLDEGGLDTARLVVEYMDTDTPAGLDDAWQKLRAQGCGRATGRAGMGADFIKLPPSCTQRIHADAVRRDRAAATIEDTRQRGLRVIAEGIEDARDLATLCELECDCAQGFLLGIPAAEPARQLSRSVAGLIATAFARAALSRP